MVFGKDETSKPMAKLHNGIVRLIDKSKLTPSETTMVLRLVISDIEALFKAAVGEK